MYIFSNFGLIAKFEANFKRPHFEKQCNFGSSVVQSFHTWICFICIGLFVKEIKLDI